MILHSTGLYTVLTKKLLLSDKTPVILTLEKYGCYQDVFVHDYMNHLMRRGYKSSDLNKCRIMYHKKIL